MIRITRSICLNEDEIEEKFIRSPGPGGQNVNKVETAVELRFNAAGCPNLTPEVFAKLLPLAGRRMTADGILIIEAHRFRTQDRNREDARQRLVELVRRAAQPVKPRRATRPTLASMQRRLEGKQRRGGIKRLRGKGLASD